MVRKAYVLMAMLFSLWLGAAAQGDAAAEVKRLQSRMYKLYPTNDYDAFMLVTDSLKEACLKAGDERFFYKAWGNQALFSCNRQRRNRGLAIAKEMQDYAVVHGSKFGIYSGTHVSSYILGMMGNREEAKKGLLAAANYLHEHFPGESAASDYLEVAKLFYEQSDIENCLHYSRLALKEPKLEPLHRVNAWSFMCCAVADSSNYHPKNGNYLEEFNHYYAEREKAKKAFGRGDSYEPRVAIWRAINDSDFDQAVRLCDKLRSPLQHMEMLRFVYKRMGRFEEAFKIQKKYYQAKEAYNSDRNAHLLMEMSAAMDLGRMESEAKDLKLRNQQLRLEQTASALEHERLEKEALDLSLRNRDVELQNASVKLKNDSLRHYSREMELREIKTKMEAEQDALRARTLIIMLAGGLTALIIASLLFFLHRRRVQMQQLRKAYDKLEETTSAKERIESELRIARDIQLGMVPSTFPAYPERNDIDLYARMTPAKAVGGDLYDFFLQGQTFYFCVGDVSGKGVPASMTMAVAVNLFRTVAKEGFPPAYVATKLNDTLSADNDSGLFVTMFIGMINLKTGRMDFCNAGHNPPLIIDRPAAPGEPNRTHFLEMEPNAPIGLWPELEFVGETVENVKGRQLFVYTDGVTEAENAAQEQYGDDRLLQLLSTARQPLGENVPKSRSRYLVERVGDSVKAFVGDAEQSDDLTMLAIRVF